MHLQEKIYEAIQRGLNNALDFSFDDDEDLQSNPKKKLDINKLTQSHKDQIWINENFVDLSLPSGTLWCKYNLGATCGNTPESWYGHYYMWGSTKPNDNDHCDWKNTPFNNKSDKYDEEYFEEHVCEFIDHDGNLLPEYDVAYQTDNRMHMPAMWQMQELDKETEYHWVENYNGINGLNGYLFTGKNGNTLFIPAAGYRYWSDFNNVGSYCNLWSSSLNFGSSNSAYNLWFHIENLYSFSNYSRFCGLSVHGVI